MQVKIKNTAVAGNTATIEVRAESKNYANFTIKISVEVLPPPPVTISDVTMEGGVYNASPYTMSGTPTFIRDDNGDPVEADGTETFVYSMADGKPITTPKDAAGAPIYAGSYKLTVKAPVSCAGTQTYPFTIAKKPLKVTLQDVTVNQGDPLPKISNTHVGLDPPADDEPFNVLYEGFVTPSDTAALSVKAKAKYAAGTVTTSPGTFKIEFDGTGPTLKTSGVATNYSIAEKITGTLFVNAYHLPDEPTSVSAIPGYGQAKVYFNPSLDDGIGDHNGSDESDDILQYRVTTHDGRQFYGTEIPVIATGLTNEMPYTFTVAAQNAKGWSSESEPSSLVIPSVNTLPSKITSVKAIANDEQQVVHVYFSLPGSEGNSVITHYTVTPNFGNPVTGIEIPVEIRGLAIGMPYTFTVTATNENGTSIPSDPSEPVTLKAPDTGTAIDEVKEAAVEQLHPNPATDNVTITGLQGNETLRFYDATGRTVLIHKANAPEEVITISQLQKGIYIVHTGTKALKLVKK
ncbi:hypothetical protein AGMMS49965_25880 [Bacteroidia bacterium]|nr:hypothetical protein AGMMS49965_25880 [Bacteroidia bacterium]